jgi:biotin carboxylase
MPTGFRAQKTRVAIIDAYSVAHYLMLELRRYGIESVHVESANPDVCRTFLLDGFIGSIRHDGDLGATVAALRELEVDQVIAGAESGVELADQLAAALGTPGHGMSRPSARRNKYDMVLALRDAGVPHAATMVATDPEEIVAWAETAGYPVVLKPVSSFGTDGVTACSSAEEVRATHAKIMASCNRVGLPNTVVLAQEFLAGDEYFINSVSRNGRHHTAEAWRYFKRRIPGGHIIYDYNEPLSPDDPNARRLESYTHQVLDALEIRNGASHAEVMLTARGPVLVECGARMGGGGIPDIFTRCFGTNQVDLLAQSVAEPEEFDRLPASVYQLRRHLRYVHLINARSQGVAPTREAMDPVRALPSCDLIALAHPPGHPLPPTIDFATQPGYVILTSDDEAELVADYERIRQMELESLYAGG